MMDSMQEAQLKLAELDLRQARHRPQRQSLKAESIRFKDVIKHAHPYLNHAVKFDDNINGAGQHDKKSDMINALAPGVKMNFASLGQSLTLDTHIDNLYNGKRTVDNDQSITSSFLNVFNLGYYNVSIGETYFSNWLATPEMGIRTNNFDFYWSHAFTSSIGRNFNRMGFDFGYARTDSFHNHLNKGTNAGDQTFSLSQYLKIATKTRLLLDYSHTRTANRANTGDRTNADDLAMTLTGLLSSKLSALTRVDYGATDAKTQGTSSTLGFSGNFAYRVSDRTNLSLALSRDINYAVLDTGYEIDDSFDISTNHRLAVNPKLNLSLSYGITLARFPHTFMFTHKSVTTKYGMGLSYAFRQWMDFSLNYALNRSSENYADSTKENTVIFTTQARF